MKKKKLILIVILLLVTLNMNYLGFAGKKITITSKEYQTGNSSNLVLDKILSDNELKIEIPHMFNYASNGNYVYHDEWGWFTTLNDQNYVTTGLYSNQDEDGTTYYYRGDVNNNNLQFGAFDEDYYVYHVSGYVDQYYQSIESCQKAGNSNCSQVKLAKIFLDQNVTYQVIRSSDIARAKQTAELINEGNHRPIIYTSLLREQNKGDYNGKLKSKVSTHDYHIQVYEQYPNGESLLDLYFRMKELLIKMKDWDQNLLVTHRGVINMFYYLMNEKKPDLCKEKYNVDFASIH